MKNCSYILTVILVFSFMISCESTIQEPEVEKDDQLIEKAEAYLLSNTSLSQVTFQEVLEKEGFKVPAFRVESEPNTLYMVFMAKDGAPQRVLIQEQEILEKDKIRYLHYFGPLDGASRELVGTMTVNSQGELVDWSLGRKSKDQVSASPCDQVEGEGCTGCHYSQMMDGIESNGQTDIICTFLGPICNALVYISAYIHCWKH